MVIGCRCGNRKVVSLQDVQVIRPKASDIDIKAVERETGFGWGWFVVLGVVLLGLGVVAFLNLPAGPALSLGAFGVFMLIGAVAQLATRLLAPKWKGTGFLVFSAVFYGAAAIALIANPDLLSDSLTVMVALALILSGVTRIRLSAAMPELPGWAWITASGVVTLAAGVAFVHYLLLRPVWLLSSVLAFDLFFQGVVAIAFGLALKAMTGREYT